MAHLPTTSTSMMRSHECVEAYGALQENQCSDLGRSQVSVDYMPHGRVERCHTASLVGDLSACPWIRVAGTTASTPVKDSSGTPLTFESTEPRPCSPVQILAGTHLANLIDAGGQFSVLD
jgi:hypothetical protein